jgi:hypothetical protein
LRDPKGRHRTAGANRGVAIRSERPGGLENEAVRLRAKRNSRGKRQDPWRKANGRNRNCGADLAESDRTHFISERNPTRFEEGTFASVPTLS